MRRATEGFTLIELLVVTVIVGILAALAIPRVASTKDKAKLASVKEDLHAIQVAQEAHYSGWNTYGTAAQLGSRVKFVTSPGNTFAISATTSGYTATVTNASITATPRKCQVTVGRGASGTTDGKYLCS